jgi:hypothetical protein
MAGSVTLEVVTVDKPADMNVIIGQGRARLRRPARGGLPGERAESGQGRSRGWQAESALRGTGWPTMLGTVLYGIISVAFTVWFTAIIRARWSGDGPLRARAGRASYATYFLHPLVLTAIMVLLASLALAPELKFLVVAVVAVPVCFLAGYAAARVPGVANVLLPPAGQASRTKTSADPRASQDDYVAQQVNPLDARAAELRRPEEAAGLPGRPGKVGVLEAATCLEHAHPVTLLGKP